MNLFHKAKMKIIVVGGLSEEEMVGGINNESFCHSVCWIALQCNLECYGDQSWLSSFSQLLLRLLEKMELTY